MLEPVVDALAALGVTPNMVTLFSLVPAAGAGVALAFGWFGLACVLATVGAFCDMVDGLLARKTGRGLRRGRGARRRGRSLRRVRSSSAGWRSTTAALIRCWCSCWRRWAASSWSATRRPRPRRWASSRRAGSMRRGRAGRLSARRRGADAVRDARCSRAPSLALRELPIVLASTSWPWSPTSRSCSGSRPSIARAARAEPAAAPRPAGRRSPTAGSRKRPTGQASALVELSPREHAATPGRARGSRSGCGTTSRRCSRRWSTTVMMIALRRARGPRPGGGHADRRRSCGAVTSFTARPLLHLPRRRGSRVARPGSGATRWSPAAASASNTPVNTYFHHVWDLQYMLARVITSIIVSTAGTTRLHAIFRILDGRPTSPHESRASPRTSAPHPDRRARAPRAARCARARTRTSRPGLQGYAVMAGIVVEEGRGSAVTDVDGNTFLDFIGGIGVNALGHSHPTLRRGAAGAGRPSVGRLVHLARRASSWSSGSPRTPPAPGVHRLQLYSGGAEAVESALRLAKCAHRQVRVRQLLGRLPRQDDGRAVADGLDVQGQARPDGAGRAPASRTPTATAARSSSSTRRAASPAPRSARKQVKMATAGAVAAVIVEPMQGTAGNVDPAEGVPAGGARRSPTSSARCSSSTR